MGNYIALALVTALLFGSNLALRREHPGEIYTLWYAFSLSFFVFGALSLVAESSGKDLTDALGASYAPALRYVYDMLTNFDDEMVLVGACVGISVGPQLLAYLLCAPSGSAKPPVLIERIAFFASLMIAKFLSAWGALVLSHTIAQAVFRGSLQLTELIQGLILVTAAFFLAALYHQIRDWDFSVAVFVYRINIISPKPGEVIRALHKFAMRSTIPGGLPPLGARRRELRWEFGPRSFRISVRGPGLSYVRCACHRLGFRRFGRWRWTR